MTERGNGEPMFGGRPPGTRRRLLPAAVLAGLLGGCWMSHPDLADGDRRPCRDDLDCNDGDPCTVDRCGPSGSCRHGPAPMGDRREFAGTVLPAGIVVVDGEARVLTGGRALHGIGLDGPTGGVTELPPIGGDRDWDSSAAAIGDRIAVVTHRAGGLDLRRVEAPDAIDRVEPAGLFVHLGATRARFVACTDWMDTCGLAWADRDGRWISTETESTPGACPIAWVPSSGSSTSGHPVNRYPAYVTAADEAVFLSIDRDGGLHRLTASPGEQRTETVPLDSPGPRYFHSLVAVEGEPGIGALWVQTEVDDAPEQEVRFAVLDRDLAVVAGPTVSAAADGAYVFRMALVWCEGRFVAVWNDRRGSAVAQFGPDGGLLGEVERFGSALSGGWMSLACVPRGVILADYGGTATWRCPAE